MSTQLTIFDFLPASESQADEIPVLKDMDDIDDDLAIDSFAEALAGCKSVKMVNPFDLLQKVLGFSAWYGPEANDWEDLSSDIESLQTQLDMIDDLFAQAKKEVRWSSDTEKINLLELLTVKKVQRVAQIREKIRELTRPVTKAEEFPHLSPEVLACVSDLHRQPIEYRQQLAKDLAEYNATPDAVLKERLGVLPSTVVVETVKAPEPVQLTPVRWSVARGETHLMAPGAKSPICGAPDGREGFYTATGEPYSWQTCVRGLTPMCVACEKLEKKQ